MDRRAGHFVTTRWAAVLCAARGESREAAAALAELCNDYWRPVFEFFRAQIRNADDAQDFTQAFFTHLLAKNGLRTLDPSRGRFRTFLLGAAKHFLADQLASRRALRRGGGAEVLPLGAEGTPSQMIPGASILPPSQAPAGDHAFDREWAAVLVNRALAFLAEDYHARNKGHLFTTLKPWLAAGTEDCGVVTHAAAARQLGASENAVRVAIHRLRKRFREAVRAEIARTVEGDPAVADEMRYLIEVLSA